VLDRGDGTVQVGVRSPVVFSGLSAEQRRFVERLETAKSVTHRARAPFAEIVSRLEDAGLLAAGSAERRTVALDDAGPIGLSAQGGPSASKTMLPRQQALLTHTLTALSRRLANRRRPTPLPGSFLGPTFA